MKLRYDLMDWEKKTETEAKQRWVVWCAASAGYLHQNAPAEQKVTHNHWQPMMKRDAEQLFLMVIAVMFWWIHHTKFKTTKHQKTSLLHSFTIEDDLLFLLQCRLILALKHASKEPFHLPFETTPLNLSSYLKDIIRSCPLSALAIESIDKRIRVFEPLTLD